MEWSTSPANSSVYSNQIHAKLIDWSQSQMEDLEYFIFELLKFKTASIADVFLDQISIDTHYCQVTHTFNHVNWQL